MHRPAAPYHAGCFYPQAYRTTPDEIPYRAGCFLGFHADLNSLLLAYCSRFQQLRAAIRRLTKETKGLLIGKTKCDCFWKNFPLARLDRWRNFSANRTVKTPPPAAGGVAGALAAGSRPSVGSAKRGIASSRHCGRGAASAPDTPYLNTPHPRDRRLGPGCRGLGLTGGLNRSSRHGFAQRVDRVGPRPGAHHSGPHRAGRAAARNRSAAGRNTTR